MKKIILLLFIFYFKNLFGQTYTATVLYKGEPARTCSGTGSNPTCICNPTRYIWQLKSGSTVLKSGSLSSTTSGSLVINDIPLKDSYDLSINSFCIGNNGGMCPPDANGVLTKDRIMCSIRNNCDGITLANCAGYVSLQQFRPVGLSVNTHKPWTAVYNNTGIQIGSTFPEICSGEDLQLYAIPGIAPNKFPAGVYHWQYSLDNKMTWVDVPSQPGAPYGVENKFNFTPSPNLTMENILGPSHVDYFGKEISFRLGYNSINPFTGVVTIKYSACAPVIKDRKFVGADCNNDGVKSITAYFDRNLTEGETLSPLHIIPYPTTNPTPIHFPQPPVTNLQFDPLSGYYAYSFIIPEGGRLENKNYVIEYQSQLNTVPRGTLKLDIPFLYKNPAPLTFKISSENPNCHDGTVDINIEADGGTPPYYYDNLNGETEIINNVSEIKRIQFDVLNPYKKTVTLEQLEPKEYSIKVTDNNKCIEQ